MHKKADDIYRTHRDEPIDDLLAVNQRPEALEALVRAEMRRARRSTLFFRIVVFFFLVLLGVVIYQQYLLYSRPDLASSPKGAGRHYARLGPDHDTNWRSSVLLDELGATLAEPALNEKSTAEGHLDVESIKQAAYLIVLGEKAYSEERWGDARQCYERLLAV